jgi:DNA-binding MarR family transcriptional regulator
MSAAERTGLKDDVDATLIASRALVAVIARSLADVLDQITLPQLRVLVVLCAEGPLRSGVLADRLGIHQSTFTRTADRLVAQGWIQREVSPESRREIIVELTEEGHELVLSVMKARRAEIERILRQASPEQRSAIRIGFEAFAGAAGEPEASLLLTLGV